MSTANSQTVPVHRGTGNHVVDNSVGSNDQHLRREKTMDVDTIAKAIVGVPRLSSKAAIEDFARVNNLKIQIRAKDSKRDAARKLSRSILETPTNRRSEILALIAERPDTQTQGWVEIIKGSR